MESRAFFLYAPILLVLLSVYSYLLYPILLLCLSLFIKRTVKKAAIEPAVTVLITAHNEAGTIRDKLLNSLALEYPRDKLQILVASDASTDGTDAVVRTFPEVILHRSEGRKGKESAQRDALPFATGEILIFTDVGTVLDRDAVRSMVKNFADPTVGSVSSRDKLLSGGGGNAEDIYVRYEMALRGLECRVGGVVGLSGSFFAARREVCAEWSEEITSDFNAVFLTVKKGLRAVSDDEVFGYYRDIRPGQSEFNRKVRTLVHGIHALASVPELLNVFRYGVFSWQLFSHKLMRWLAPFFMLALLMVTALGAFAGSLPCSVLLVLQGIFYGLALLGNGWKASRATLPVKIAFYFTSVNLAILTAWLRYLRGERMRVWSPTIR